MNKEYEIFHRENEEIVENLLESLEILGDKFEHGIVPGEPEKSDALYLLDVYKDAIELFNKTETPVFQRIKTDNTLFDEDATYKELSGQNNCISLLLRLSREKIIDIDDLDFHTEAGKVLLQKRFCDEVKLEESGKKYYALSSKAEKTLKSKSIISKIRQENVTAIVPNKIVLDADDWSNLYVRRVEFLKRYYSEQRENKEYILFNLDEAKEMVFGCELNNELDVTYTFAAVFDEKINDQINQLKRLANSGLIDRIVIIIDSKEMAEILEDEGIDEKHTPHISIEQL